MSRQEDFKKKRNEYVDSYCYENEITSAEMVDAIDETFDDAAEYGYQYGKDKFIDVLTHWCNRHGVHPTNRVDIINDIKQAMEE